MNTRTSTSKAAAGPQCPLALLSITALSKQSRHCEAYQFVRSEPERQQQGAGIRPSLERLGTLALEKESRRVKIFAILDADPTLRTAYCIDSDIDPDQVIATIAARG